MDSQHQQVISCDARRLSRIRPFLYVAGVKALSPNALKRFGTVVNLLPSLQLYAPSSVRVLNLPVADEEDVDLSPLWQPIFEAIDKERLRRGKLLLLCAKGISRSATFAIGYLTCIEKMTLHDAYKHTQRARSIICPNVGFFRQLIELEIKMLGQQTVQIVQPMPEVLVADVLWNELFDEMLAGLSQEERDTLRHNQRTSLKEDKKSSESSLSSLPSFVGDDPSLAVQFDRLSLSSIR